MIYINRFIEIITLIMIYSIMYKRNGKKELITSILLAGIYTILTPVKFGSTLHMISNLGMIVVFSLAIKILYKEKILDAIAKVSLAFVILMIPENISEVLLYITKLERDTVFLTLFLLFSSYITLLVVFYIREKLDNSKYKISLLNIKIAIMGVVSLCLIFIVIKEVKEQAYISEVYKTCIYAIIISFVICSIFIFRDIIKEMSEKKKLEIRCQYNDILEEYLERIRSREHEYKNHLNAIYTMLEIGTSDEIKDLVKKYIEKNQSSGSISRLMYIKNPILKEVLYSKLCEAEKKDIHMEFEIKSNLDNTKLSEEDIVVVLSNLLNNAIEAAKDSREKKIKISIEEYCVKDKIKQCIKVKNSGNNLKKIEINKIIQKGYSTKGEGRGFGLYNIQQVVTKYKGNMLFDIEDDENIIIEINI